MTCVPPALWASSGAEFVVSGEKGVPASCERGLDVLVSTRSSAKWMVPFVSWQGARVHVRAFSRQFASSHRLNKNEERRKKHCIGIQRQTGRVATALINAAVWGV